MVQFYRINTADEYKHYKSASELPTSAVNKGLVEHTTSHGLPHISHARGILKPVFYTVITLALISLWLYNTYVVVALYLSYPTSIDVDISTERQLVFPAVTVCNMNSVRTSKMDPHITATIKQPITKTHADPKGQGNNAKGLDTEKSERRSMIDYIGRYLSQLSLSQRQEFGHQRDDMILYCEYAGYQCWLSSFTSMYNWNYGNCYSINIGHSKDVELKHAHSTGPSHALKLIINIEQDEYIGAITDKAGARVIVHHQGQMPFPEENGIDVGPGRSTSIAVRQTTLSRLGGKYGACVNTSLDNSRKNVFEEIYPWTKYTLSACQKTCYQKHLIDQCGCHSVKFPSTGHSLGNRNVSVCSLLDEGHAICENNVTLFYNNGTLQCDCVRPCSDTYFSLTTSSVAWPAKSYKDTLVDQLRNGKSGGAIEKMLKDNEFEENILQIEVYYEELNYEKLTQSASYELMQLLSDSGGAVGLWMGASMVTCFEFFEYFLDLIVLMCAKVGSVKPKIHSPT